jgi:hypothetical protein
VVGDFNGDQKSDLATTDFESGTVNVLLGNGNGTFQPFVSYATAGFADYLALGDLNNDGIQDLVVVNDSAPTSVSVLFGNSNGTFKAAANFEVGNDADAVILGDVDGDRATDIGVVDRFGGSVTLLLNKGSGTFKIRQSALRWRRR